MRIISGIWGGRTLVSPKGDATRPTADRTREALFSMLVSRVGEFDGLKVADLFAGSGALGFEALSRGAAECTFVEMERAALDCLRANAEKLGVKPDIRAQSALTVAPAAAPYDIIMMDPPYGSGAGAVALDKLKRFGWIGPATIISIETSRKEKVEVAGFEAEVVRDYGKARVTLLRLAAPKEEDDDD
jgi:16S rRNA (guanine966-N2)-methyltransferase